MDFITIVLIAIGLSFDTFAVSVSTGLTISHIRFWQAIRMAVVLAFFQALMPLIGWLVGQQMEALISNYDHWIAFILLTLLGFKMIYESLKNEKADEGFNPLKLTVLTGIAIATSIDALVVGVSFAFINVNIYWSIIIIGTVTFLVSMIGIFFGKKVGNRLGKRMEILGGLILLGIGIKNIGESSIEEEPKKIPLLQTSLNSIILDLLYFLVFIKVYILVYYFSTTI